MTMEVASRRRRRSLSGSRSSVPRMLLDERIILNVGGVKFQTLRSTLHRVPDSLLADLAQNNQYFDDQRHEYFFDRSSTVFEHILNYYRTGELHMPAPLCADTIKAELDFWRIPESGMSDCCWIDYAGQLERRTDRSRIRTLLAPLFVEREESKKPVQKQSLAEKYARKSQPKPSGASRMAKRVLDELRTTRHYVNARLMLLALRDSRFEIGLFVGLLVSGLSVLTVLVWLVEPRAAVPGLLSAICWALSTVTTLGYGSGPATTLGYCLSALCAALGVFVVSVPLPLVAAKFNAYYGYLEQSLKIREREERAAELSVSRQNSPKPIHSSSNNLNVELPAWNDETRVGRKK